MEQMIRGQYINQGEDLTKVLKLRSLIFGSEADERDPDAVNLFVSLVEHAEDEGTDVGCGRLNFDIDHFRFYIDRLGILEEFRRNGYGEFALRALVDKASQCGPERIYIEKEKILTQEAQDFFRRMFFLPSEEENGRFLVAEISSFHTCCH